MSPQRAIDTFISSRKNNQAVPDEVTRILKNYKKWDLLQLKGLLNASAYYPDILPDNAESFIQSKLEKAKLNKVPLFR